MNIPLSKGILNVLVIGDTILDEYRYCDVIGKSSKDPALAVKYQSHDLFAGGVLAVANHVANFANKVRLVTVLGDHDSHEKFIRSQLHPDCRITKLSVCVRKLKLTPRKMSVVRN